MNATNSERIRAAIISTILSAFPVLNLLGIMSLTNDEFSVLSLFVNNAVTTFFLMLPNKEAVDA